MIKKKILSVRDEIDLLEEEGYVLVDIILNLESINSNEKNYKMFLKNV